MTRVALVRASPGARLSSIASAAARRQAAAMPVLVEIAVDEIAAELGTSLAAINASIETIDVTLANYDDRLSALEMS